MKIYTLLRDNRELGSFTYGELLQVKLKKTDLLWVEGESLVWKHPSEMTEFKGIVGEAALTEGTVVNNRKEKQIRYFAWKSAHTLPVAEALQMYASAPDAYLADIPGGYEFLLTRSNADDIANGIIYESLAKEQEQQMEYGYAVLGTTQTIDTREAVAGAAFFESTVNLPLRYNSRKGEKPGKEEAEIHPEKIGRKRKGSVRLSVLVMLVTAAFMHLRL